MELNSGPKIVNSTCGKTINVETIDRDSTVYCIVVGERNMCNWTVLQQYCFKQHLIYSIRYSVVSISSFTVNHNIYIPQLEHRLFVLPYLLNYVFMTTQNIQSVSQCYNWVQLYLTSDFEWYPVYFLLVYIVRLPGIATTLWVKNRYVINFRLLWPCIMNVGWRKRNQQDATNLMFIIKLLSPRVSGIIMPIIRRTRVCTAANGVLHCNKRGTKP